MNVEHHGEARMSDPSFVDSTLHIGCSCHRISIVHHGLSFGLSFRVFGNWSEGSNMPKRYGSSFCGEQLTRRGELLGFLQAGWSLPTVNAPGLPVPFGAVGVPRTPTGKPILFGNCSPHRGASASLSPDVFRRLSVAAFAGLLRFHRSERGTENCVVCGKI